MTRYHATVDGMVPFTTEEEAEWDAIEARPRDLEYEQLVLEQEIREERDRKLIACDWMGCTDVTMTDEWKTYRQALRDVPLQKEFPDSVTWPTKPS